MLFQQISPNIIHFKSNVEMIRMYHCNTAHHINFMMVLLIMLQLVCLVQAFRGRHLPGPMNDAMSLVYSTMITTMTFMVSFPIGYFQEVREKEFVQCIVVVINCLVLALFLYGKKCFIIIWRRHKNTKTHFNAMTMAQMSSSAGLTNTQN